MRYVIIMHQPSGAMYAAQIEDTNVLKAYGELHHSEAKPELVQDILDNQTTDTLEETAAWLNTQQWTEWTEA